MPTPRYRKARSPDQIASAKLARWLDELPSLDFQLLLTWSQGFKEQLDPGQCYRWFAANDVACHLTQNGHPKLK